MQVINMILPILYILVALVVIWLVIELAITARNTRKTLKDVQESVDKAVQDVNKITNEIIPAVQKIDPMMERLNLTIDAANLELMRLDDIMSDVSEITSKGVKAANSIDTVTSAPLNLVNNVADKVRRRFGPKKASKNSLKIGEGKLNNNEEDPIKKLVDSIDDAIGSDN